MSRQLDSASDAASSVGGASDAGSEAGKSEAGSQGEDHGNDLLKESKFSLKVCCMALVNQQTAPCEDVSGKIGRKFDLEVDLCRQLFLI